MAHGGLGALAPSQQPGGGAVAWVERGAITDANVRRVWLRNDQNIPTSAAGLTTLTSIFAGASSCGVPGARFTRSSDSLVVTVAADDIIAVSAA